MSIKLRITLITAAFLAFALVAMSVFSYREQREHLRASSLRKVELALSMLSQTASPYLRQGDILELAYIADQTALGQPVRVCVADRHGIILADSDHELYGESLPAIKAAMRTGRRYVSSSGGILRGASAAREQYEPPAGYVYVELSTEPMSQTLREVRRSAIVFAIASIALAVLVAYATGRHVSRSLSPLLQGIRSTAGGAFEATIPTTGMTELDEIGRALNKMARLVGRQVQDLATFNELAAKLSASGTPEQFAATLDETCRSLLPASASLLLGDPTTGATVLVNGEPPNRRVTPECAAFRAVDERRSLIIGRSGELAPGAQVAEGVRVASAVVVPMTSPDKDPVGVLAVVFEPEQRPTPARRDVETVTAVANQAGPVLAALTRSWSSQKAVGALREILLPEAIPQPSGLEVFGYFEPAEAEFGLGGDYYDVLQVTDDVWAFAIGDVSGKGLDAGRYTAMTKYVIRSYALEYRSPAKAMAHAERTLAVQMGEPHFVTVFLGAIDTVRDTLTYCCAGHIPGILHSPESGETRELREGGGLVGFGLSPAYTEETTPLRPGDVLLLCTDGITEARRNSEEYGLDRLKGVLRANAHGSLEEIATNVREDVRAFSGNIARDDITLLLARVKPGA